MQGFVEIEFYNADETQIGDHIFDWLDGFDYEPIVERVEQEGNDVFVYLEVDVFGEPQTMWDNMVEGMVDSAVKVGLASRAEVTGQDYGF